LSHCGAGVPAGTFPAERTKHSNVFESGLAIAAKEIENSCDHPLLARHNSLVWPC
jgi:hypothetical protein